MKLLYLHDTVRRIYKKIYALFGLEVLGENGEWSEITSLNVTDAMPAIRLNFDNGKFLICAENHILIKENHDEIFAHDSLNSRIIGKTGPVRVISIDQCEDRVFYDLSLKDATNHLYFTNNVLSHNCVIMDEAAFVPNNIASRVFESIYPVISSSKTSQFIMVSTPNGADPNNLYYSVWQQANQKVKDKNSEGWKAFRFDWFEVPGRDEQWKRNTIASIGQRRFAQEFGNEFLSNLQTKKLVDDDIIEKFRIHLSEYKLKGIEPKIQRIVSENQSRIYEFQMWHAFDSRRTYVASADIAEGIGGDQSVLYIWDITETKKIKMCAKFASNKVSLTEFAYICSKILAIYGNPFLFAERNGLSSGMIDALRITYEYPNIACESKNGEAGVYSHVSVKLKACLWAREMLTTDGFDFVIYDKELIDEMSTFVKKDGKSDKTMYAAISPAHDDCIMSFIWGCYALNTDIIDKYFIIAQSFKSIFDQMYPMTILPLQSYSSDMLKRIHADPLYTDFIEFKEQAVLKNKKRSAQFEDEDRHDIFKYYNDPYFGDGPEPEWGSSWDLRMPTQNTPRPVNANNRMPVFFIN